MNERSPQIREQTNDNQPSRGAASAAVVPFRAVETFPTTSRRPSGQQQQQQQQPVAAPAAKPKPTASSPLERLYTDDQYSNVCTQPGSREEAEAQMAYWEDQATSHFNNKTKYENLYIVRQYASSPPSLFDNSNQQPTRGGFGHGRGGRSSNLQQQQQQQQQRQQQQAAEVFQASKVATLPSHFMSEGPKPTQLPEVPVAETAIAESLQAALDERAAKRQKVKEKEE
ncbi:hypothetical protein FNYG_13118 [Fusarium nygamai]|uniref:Uncharacterized protein n=1 Tax=Gibberella nygamai TaxID=42673 RepID=A0A2K0VU37_GIBNY|nr:hypothetical protein FNYG_13118 [Fusarium nygamai]